MFDQARIRLTLWYTVIIMAISLSFSIVVYQIQTREIERFVRLQQIRVERRLPGIEVYSMPLPERDEDLLDEVRNRILSALGMVNLGILVLASASGYLLSGRTLQPIKEMVDEQNRFVSDASHELRTPLTSLKSAIEVYLRDKKSTLADSRKLATESLAEINKIQSLSDAMLQLAQFQKPIRKIKSEKINLQNLVKTAAAKMEPIAKNKNIVIEVDVPEMTVTGDEFELPEVFIILLDNAIKYSKDGGKIKVSAAKKDKYAIVKVSDEGIGINEQDLPHIFERFYRADSARTKTDAGGYGLGLSIAQKIVEENSGKIEAESKPDKGTTFLVYLPVNSTRKIGFS
jgi:signal transduction histidine kinase